MFLQLPKLQNEEWGVGPIAPSSSPTIASHQKFRYGGKKRNNAKQQQEEGFGNSFLRLVNTINKVALLVDWLRYVTRDKNYTERSLEIC